MKLCNEIVDFHWQYRCDEHRINLERDDCKDIIDDAYHSVEQKISRHQSLNFIIREDSGSLSYNFGPVAPIVTANHIFGVYK